MLDKKLELNRPSLQVIAEKKTANKLQTEGTQLRLYSILSIVEQVLIQLFSHFSRVNWFHDSSISTSPSIKTVALSFSKDMTDREMKLRWQIELRPYMTGDAARHRHYRHVIFRMVKRLQEKKSLRKVDVHKNIVAKLGNILGPYYARYGSCGEGGSENRHV